MSDISADQANWFAAEYRYGGDIARLRQVVLLVDRYPKVLTSDGASVDGDTLDGLIAKGLLPPRNAGTGDHTRVRVRMDDSDAPAGVSSIQFEWRSDEVVKWRATASAQLPKYGVAPKRAPISP